MNRTPYLETIRTMRGFNRTWIYLVAVALVGLIAERTIYYVLVDTDVIEPESNLETLYRVAPQKARQLGLSKPQKPAKKSNDAILSQSILETRDVLDVLAYELHREGGDPAKSKSQLNDLVAKLKAQDQQAMADFQKTGRHIEKHNLPDVIKERHRTAVSTYRNEMDTFLANLQTALAAEDAKARFDAVMAARKHLEGKQLERSQQPFDPNNLPHKSMQPNPDNKPKLTKAQFTEAGLHNNPLVQYASHGSYTFGNLAGASNPAYLAETDEVKITPAIQAKADELQHDPVQIYNWVRNNVEWIPSWGAMQDSDITLGSLRGNAMDISSLLIALYRASGIPARYVHGTIEIPEDKFRNWAGGFESIEAAADYASSGGIPTAAVLEGGRIASVRMEHIWAEAAIDFEPSRGAINRDADSWVQLDASYKQYEYLQGLDLQQVTGMDPGQLTNEFLNSGTINDTEGWVSGFDSAILQNSQIQTKSVLSNHITTVMQNATVGDVIGGRLVIESTQAMLPSSISSAIKVIGLRYAALPTQLQASVEFQLGSGIEMYVQPKGSSTLPWAKVNNQKVILQFKPESASDEQAIKSLIPEGEVTSLSQLPNTIPAYLINVVPQLLVNDELITEFATVSLGVDLKLKANLSSPSRPGQTLESVVISGSYLVITAFANSISVKKIEETEVRLNSTKVALETSNSLTLSKDDFLDDMLYMGSMSYFSEYQAITKIAARNMNVVSDLLPTIGTFGYEPQVNYFFGLPSSISTGGVRFDLIGIAMYSSSINKTHSDKIDYILHSGFVSSALEHTILEQFFKNDSGEGEGVSSVKVLQNATQLGQKLVLVNNANKDSILPSINHSSQTMSDINSALNANKVVITHESPVSISGWNGSGYIILDTETGDGAYKIEGGANGGWIIILVFLVLAILILVALFAGQFLIAALLAWQFWVFAQRVKYIARTASSPEQAAEMLNQAVFLTAIGTILSFAPWLRGGNILQGAQNIGGGTIGALTFGSLFSGLWGWGWFRD